MYIRICYCYVILYVVYIVLCCIVYIMRYMLYIPRYADMLHCPSAPHVKSTPYNIMRGSTYAHAVNICTLYCCNVKLYLYITPSNMQGSRSNIHMPPLSGIADLNARLFVVAHLNAAYVAMPAARPATSERHARRRTPTQHAPHMPHIARHAAHARPHPPLPPHMGRGQHIIVDLPLCVTIIYYIQNT